MYLVPTPHTENTSNAVSKVRDPVYGYFTYLTNGACSPFYAALHDPSRNFTPVNVTRDNYKR